MRIPRIYTTQTLIPGATVRLEAAASQHILKVLRLTPSQPLSLFNNSPWDYPAVLQAIDSGSAWVLIQAPLANSATSPLTTILVQGLSRAERMDFTIQKAVELGISQIIPVQTERSLVKLDAKRALTRHQHWQQVIHSACEQCGRSELPQLHEVMPLWAGLQHPAVAASHRWLLDPQATHRLAQHSPAPTHIALLIGPEGGFSELERQQAHHSGFTGMCLGPRVLRTETAALAALAVIQHQWGDLAGA